VTLAYEYSGRLIHVRSASGESFYTNYGANSVIESVLRGGSTGSALVTDTYVTSGPLNGTVENLTGDSSKVSQSFTSAFTSQFIRGN